MSFGCPSQSEFNKVRRAIRLAAKRESKEILLFAAASNGGGNRQRAYPAKDHCVFCIHSSNGHGNKSGFNPNPVKDDRNFSVVGQHVESAWPVTMSKGEDYVSRRSGTSYATPVAAGIAAFVIEFVRQNMLHEDIATQKAILDSLQSYAGMRAVFCAMAEDRDSYDYICPWEKLFRPRRPDISIYSEIKEKLEIS